MMRNSGVWLEKRQNHSVFFVLIVVFISIFASACQKYVSPVVDKPRIVENASITYTEQDFTKVSGQDIEAVPEKELKPIWNFPSPTNKEVLYIESTGDQDPPILFFIIQDPLDPDKIYLDFSQTLVAFDPVKEKVRWEYELIKLSITGIVFTNNTVYIGTDRGPSINGHNAQIVSLDAKTGKEKKIYPYSGSKSNHLTFVNPLIYYVYTGFDGEFIDCIDTEKEEKIFTIPVPMDFSLDFAYYKSPFYDKDVLYLVNKGINVIVAFNTIDHSFSNVFQLPQNDHYWMTQPTVLSNHLVFASKQSIDAKYTSFNRIHSLFLDTRKTDWNIDLYIKSRASILRSVSILEDKIYFLCGRFMACIDPMTKKILYSLALDIPNGNHEFFVIHTDSGKVFVQVQEVPKDNLVSPKKSTRYVLAIDATSGKMLWKMKKGIWLQGFKQKKLIVGDGKSIMVIDPD